MNVRYFRHVLTALIVMVAGVWFGGIHTTRAEDIPSGIDVTKPAKGLAPTISMPALPSMPAVSLPSMPDFSMPDVSHVSGGLMVEFNAFTQQVGDSLPLLEEMGYEVSTFRVQWGLPPKAKLRLRSKGAIDPKKVSAAVAKAKGGLLMTSLVASAATAKQIQSMMKLGTAIIDIDFALPPKVRMSFLRGSADDKKDPAERDVEDLDLACGQALAGN